MIKSIMIQAAASALLMTSQLLAADTYTTLSISYESASAIIKNAVKDAAAHKRNVAVVVVDADGDMLALARMDGAKPLSADIALKKAKTALLFRGPSRTAQTAINEGSVNILTLDVVAGFAGGLPILIDEEIVGAIGVSGAPADIDEKIAAAGLKQIAN